MWRDAGGGDGVAQFAAKYNIVLPEYAIDSDLLIEKVTA